MVILKKLKASTLIETVTASIIIIIVFTIASLTLNNVFSNTITRDTSRIRNYINKLEYEYLNKKITIPYKEIHKNWEISVTSQKENLTQWVVFQAKNSSSKVMFFKKILYVDK